LRIVPELLLGLLLLNDLCRKGDQRQSVPMDMLLRVAAGSAALIAAEVLFQKATGFTWSFDENPPSGPFNNRNTTSPALIFFGLLSFAAAARHASQRKIWMAFGAGLIFLACVISSRNGLFLAGAVGVFFIVQRTRAIWILPLLLVAAAAFCFLMPLPATESVDSPGLKRVVMTVEMMRTGDWGAVTSYRSDLYRAALKIFASHPILGSGPTSFPMQAGPGGLFAVDAQKVHYMSAHSMPLNLLAETGLIGMCAWMAIWLAIPAYVLWREKSRSLLWLTVLAMGIANILDTVWFAAGLTTLSIFMVWWACWEHVCESPSATS
jgi:O-antigen ligase